MIWPQCDLGTPWFQVSSRKCLVLRGIYPFPLALPLDQNENWDSPYSHMNRVGYRLEFFRYLCQIDTFKTVPVPEPILIKNFLPRLAISTKHMGPVSQTGLRLTLDYTSLYQKFDYSLFLNLHLSLFLLPLLACTYFNNA